MAEFHIFLIFLCTQVVLMTKLTLGENSFQNRASKILKALLTKNFQLLYSGCGRKVKGVGKENFSSTNTYKCMQSIYLLDI